MADIIVGISVPTALAYWRAPAPVALQRPL